MERGEGADGGVRTVLADGKELTADEIPFATGRAPRTTDDGLETVGRKPTGTPAGRSGRPAHPRYGTGHLHLSD